MPSFGPIKRRALIDTLRQLGFHGPFAGGKHQFMARGSLRVRVPNPHQADIGRALLAKILREADISRDEWEAV
jgi:predicted RNA binding protein YcfA (HicA-like mRNA interferase family)